ncbi:MAG: hypothetical protein H6741_20600 [Alphaproteobacteria bacterium]|nr:hypothetical protein [Alphaproteobacteria bacterium]MCB9758202.1 hypothetical protein [Alphaproteobacteria bacterium]MCB9795109.1 hypothetical protein [Alphaproteobacteria bacterium]
MKTILAVTCSDEDTTFVPLAKAVEARGGRLLRFDTDRFPHECQLSGELVPGTWRGEVVNHLGERVALDALHAVWWRRMRTGLNMPKEGVPPHVRRAARLESEVTLEGLIASLPIQHVDDPFLVHRAERKAWQFAQATAVGLHIPETWLGNAGPSALRFAGRQDRLITKGMSLVLIPGPHGNLETMPTSAVGPEELETLPGDLAWSTACLQARVDKTMEVRAVVVGDRVLAAGVDSQQLEVSEVDWREGDFALMPQFRRVDLPDALAAKLVALNRRMGLRYGGADLIRTPEGEWIFLEINPGGEWGWVQEFAELDVAGTLADLLLAD